MDQQSSVEMPATLNPWQRTKAAMVQVPTTVWIVLGLFLVAAVLLAIHTAVASHEASLRLKGQHSFHSAQLTVWVDGDVACSTRLAGSTKKRFGLIPNSVQGTFSELIPLSAGKHLVRVRVEPDDGTPLEDSASGEVAKDTETQLNVSARRSGISLSWQRSAPTDVSQVPSGWFTRYAVSLFLTIAGSIISALTGYAIRELPAHLRTRQASEPKA